MPMSAATSRWSPQDRRLRLRNRGRRKPGSHIRRAAGRPGRCRLPRRAGRTGRSGGARRRRPRDRPDRQPRSSSNIPTITLGVARSPAAQAGLDTARGTTTSGSRPGRRPLNLSRQRYDTARADAPEGGGRGQPGGGRRSSGATAARRGAGSSKEAEAQRPRPYRQPRPWPTTTSTYPSIRAPVDGVIGNRASEAGQYVQPGPRLLARGAAARTLRRRQLQGDPGRRHEAPANRSTSVDAFPAAALHGTRRELRAGTGSRFSLLPPDNATGNFTKVVQRVPVRIALRRPIAAVRPAAAGPVGRRSKVDIRAGAGAQRRGRCLRREPPRARPAKLMAAGADSRPSPITARRLIALRGDGRSACSWRSSTSRSSPRRCRDPGRPVGQRRRDQLDPDRLPDRRSRHDPAVGILAGCSDPLSSSSSRRAGFTWHESAAPGLDSTR